MSRPVTTPHGGDRGLALVLAALLLVVLLGFAAFAVDLGQLYNARRQDQSAADLAALAAAAQLPADTIGATATAQSFVATNLGISTSDLDWAGCVDDEQLVSSAVGTSCVSFDAGRRRVRVRIPDQTAPSVFASVLGIDGFTHTAEAEAERRRIGFGGIIPFGIPGLGSGGGLICPKEPPAGVATAPCSGPTTGSFGYVDVGHWTPAGSVNCPPGGEKGRAPRNIAMGSDHDLFVFDGTQVNETDVCGVGPPPNAIPTWTGNVPNQLADGFYTTTPFMDGEGGRLTRSSDDLPTSIRQTVTVNGVPVDNTPLWSFVSPTLPDGAPASCSRSTFVDGDGTPRTDFSGVVANFSTTAAQESFVSAMRSAIPESEPELRMIALLDRCFTHYQGLEWGDAWGIDPEEPSPCSGPCSGVIFGVNSRGSTPPWDIQLTPRFAYVPEFFAGWEPGPGASQPDEPIRRFRAVYIQSTCLTNPCQPDDVQHAGFSQPARNVSQSSAFTAWAFVDGMLPPPLSDPNAPNQPPNQQILLVR